MTAKLEFVGVNTFNKCTNLALFCAGAEDKDKDEIAKYIYDY